MVPSFTVGRFLPACSLAGFATLLLNGLLAHAQAPTLLSSSPVRNAIAAPRAANVALTFSQPISAASAGNVRVFSSQRGGQRVRNGNANVSGDTLTVDPVAYFRPGETVFVTVPPTLKGTGGAAATKHVYQFTAAVGGTGRGTFVAPAVGAEVPMGSEPRNVVIGDIDGDGDLDLLALTQGDGTLSVRRNDGNGTFSGTQNIRVGYALRTTLGDVDGDGDLDLLVPRMSADAVSVWLNNGVGSFSNASSVSVAGYPNSVTLGDVDGDGDLDLLSTHNSAFGSGDPGKVSVRLNDGMGAFSGSYSVSVDSSPQNAVVADIDSDGDLDLLTANSGTFSNASTVSVRRNDGSGNFGGTQNIRVGGGPSSLAVGDVDGDNDLDFLSANEASTTVSLRLNDGTGSFGDTTNLTVGYGPHSVALGDIDSDGDLDLLTATYYGYVNVQLNNGMGHFNSAATSRVGDNPYSVVLGDIDRDGDLDFLTANLWGSTVSVRLNGGTGPVEPEPIEPGPTPEPEPTDTIPAAELVTVYGIYPNLVPASGSLAVAGAPADQLLKLFDMQGRRVATLQTDSKGTASMSSSALRSGLYLLRAADGRTARLVVE